MEHVAEIRVRVFSVALAGDDEGVKNRGALAGIRVADEQPVFLSDRRGADRIFDQVVVELGAAMLLMRGERFPLIEQIRAGFAESGLG